MLHGSFLCESWAMTVAADPGCWRSDMVDAGAQCCASEPVPQPRQYLWGHGVDERLLDRQRVATSFGIRCSTH